MNNVKKILSIAFKILDIFQKSAKVPFFMCFLHIFIAFYPLLCHWFVRNHPKIPGSSGGIRD